MCINLFNENLYNLAEMFYYLWASWLPEHPHKQMRDHSWTYQFKYPWSGIAVNVFPYLSNNSIYVSPKKEIFSKKDIYIWCLNYMG